MAWRARREWRGVLRSTIERARWWTASRNRRITTKVLPNASAADAIAHYQQSQGINFLLMGAYGHSRIRRLLIGSTTTEFIQRCLVPVVLFR